MDGNRRFSKRLMKAPWKGHEWGAKKLVNVLDWCREHEIKEVTLYSFSYQNFKRSEEEFEQLMRIFRENFDKLINDKRLSEHEIKVNVIGRIEEFPEDVQERLVKVMEKTKDYNKYIVNFAMAYGGQEEIVDACKNISKKVKEGELLPENINKEIFEQHLYMASRPDLIVRTGGEKRTSNFLAYQSAYSEWVFVEKMWPEFEKKDFEQIINQFCERKRRFGK